MSLQSFINSDFSQYKTYTQMLPKGIPVLICAAENCLQFKYIPANVPQWIAIKNEFLAKEDEGVFFCFKIISNPD